MGSEVRRITKGIFMLGNPKIWITCAIPLSIGAVLAFSESSEYRTLENVAWLMLALFTICLIELGKHGINEYVDFVTGVDTSVPKENVTPFSGGRKTLTDGVLSLKEVAVISVMTLVPAVIIGLIITVFKTENIFPIGFLGVILSIIYTLPPIKLCYRGFGELAVGICYGPLMVLGTYVLITEKFSVIPFLASVPIGLIVANILIINEFPDYEADISGNKRNAVVRLGKKHATVLFGLMYVLSYASIIFMALYTHCAFWLIALLSLPMAVKAWLGSKENYNNIPKLAVVSMGGSIKLHTLMGILLAVASIMQNMF